MSTTTTIKSFLKQFAAVITGDSTAAIGEKVLRRSDSALRAQIATLGGQLIGLEDKLEAAKDKETLALVNNGRLIEDDSAYVEGILQAANNVTKAEEAEAALKKKIAFLQSKLDFLSKTEEA